MEPRTAAAGFNTFEAAIFSEARSMVDWNARNKVHTNRLFFIKPLTSFMSSSVQLAGLRHTPCGQVGNLRVQPYCLGLITPGRNLVLQRTFLVNSLCDCD